jgi:hypothetical protein
MCVFSIKKNASHKIPLAYTKFPSRGFQMEHSALTYIRLDASLHLIMDKRNLAVITSRIT